MSYVDTGYPAVDAKEHMKIHLETQQATWGVKEIVAYPKALMESINPPVIEIGFQNEEEPEFLGIGNIPPPVQHTVFLKVWYFSELFSVKSKFDDVILILSKIRKFLIQNPSPDSYGHLYAGSGGLRMRGLNIHPGTIGIGDAFYTGGYIDVYLRVILEY
jgi:hypothetical protein